MPANMSHYLADRLVGWLRGTNMPTAPAGMWVGLMTVAMDKDGAGGTEVLAADYVRRQLIVPAASGDPRTTAVASSIVWPDALTIWGTIVQAVVFDAQTVGNPLLMGAPTAMRTVDVGERAVVDAGTLTITVK